MTHFKNFSINLNNENNTSVENIVELTDRQSKNPNFDMIQMLNDWKLDKDNFFVEYLNTNNVSKIIEIVKNSVYEKQKLTRLMHHLDNFILHGKAILTAKIKQTKLNNDLKKSYHQPIKKTPETARTS